MRCLVGPTARLVFEGAPFRQDVLSVLVDLGRHHADLLDNVDTLLQKWSAEESWCLNSSKVQFGRADEKPRPSNAAYFDPTESSQTSKFFEDAGSIDQHAEHRKIIVSQQYDRAIDRFKKRPSLGTSKMDHQVTSRLSSFQNSLRWCSGCNACETVVRSLLLNTLVPALILVNAVVVGYEVNLQSVLALEDYDLRFSGHGPVFGEEWIQNVDIAINAFFVFELPLRLAAFQERFCFGQDWKWNVFDVFMVSASLMELGLSVDFDLSYIRVLRALRITRSFRMIHLLKFAVFRNLRLMLMAIIRSVIPLLWAGLILVILMFFFAVILLDGVAEYTSEADLTDMNFLLIKEFLPNLGMTMHTLSREG